jgi:hypothetical protein
MQIIFRHLSGTVKKNGNAGRQEHVKGQLWRRVATGLVGTPVSEGFVCVWEGGRGFP